MINKSTLYSLIALILTLDMYSVVAYYYIKMNFDFASDYVGVVGSLLGGLNKLTVFVWTISKMTFVLFIQVFKVLI
jgi:hypothetical protein